MGVSKVLKLDPVRLARDVIASKEDEFRRRDQADRRAIFEEDSETAIKNEIARVFTDETVKKRIFQFARMAQSQAIAKRVINELARPVYVVPPVRTVKPKADQKKLEAISSECRLDDRMSTALSYAIAENTAFLQTRYVPRLDKIVVDVLPADVVSVIEDPDDPHRELAIIYDKMVRKSDGKLVKWRVYWDDEEKFQLDENFNLVPFADGAGKVKHGLGRIPFVAVHTAPRISGSYWNTTYRESLFATQRAASMLVLLSLRKLKARGFRQMIITGDIRSFPKGQLLDEEVALLAPDGTNISETSTEADSANYLQMLDALEQRAAANHGISRARMNQDGDGDDTGLMEQRAEMIKLMRPVELEQFEVFKAVSREYPEPSRHLSEKATMAIDYGELTERVDPKAELEVWEIKRRMGVANVYDQIKALNPEIRTNEDAKAELKENMRIEAEYVESRRALNIAEGTNAHEPGQDPAVNGAMGPAVRDGEMTKDEAAEQARGHANPDKDED